MTMIAMTFSTTALSIRTTLVDSHPGAQHNDNDGDAGAKTSVNVPLHSEQGHSA